MFISSTTNPTSVSSNMNSSSLNSNLCSNLNLNPTGLNTFDQDYASHHSSGLTSGHLGPHAHHFASHYLSHHQAPSSLYNSSPSSFSSQPFEQNQFSSLNRYQNTHGLHSSFAPSPFHLSLPKSNFVEHSIGNSSLSGPPTLMPNDSCNSSTGSSSGSSSNSPNSSSSSSPDSKFNFLHTPQSSYLNYLNQNAAFTSQSTIQNSIQHQLPSSTNSNTIHHPSIQHPYSSFNQSSKPFNSQLNNQLNSQLSNQVSLYDEDDLRGEDEEDEVSMSHLDIKAMMQYTNYSGSEPLPGKTRTREKYRSVYSELQRNELETEFLSSKYITIKRKAELAQKLALSERQIKIWFQNRRAKNRRQVHIKCVEKKPYEQQQFEQYCHPI